MRRGKTLVALLCLAVGVAHAEPPDPRAALAEQLAAELATLEKTIATVDGKVAEAQAVRIRRIRAAYRILRGRVPHDASATDRMSAARRRAAARLLLERDRAERALLADEVSVLRAADAPLRAATTELDALVLPSSLAAPAKGVIVRKFGTLVHDLSKATLARRGIDFEVTPTAAATAAADGVVRFAGPMRGLDHGVILDHGTYLTVTAKLGDVAIPVGTKLVAGDRIGRAARARVYFEVRAKVGPGGLPIDPEPLLKGSDRK